MALLFLTNAGILPLVFSHYLNGVDIPHRTLVTQIGDLRIGEDGKPYVPCKAPGCDCRAQLLHSFSLNQLLLMRFRDYQDALNRRLPLSLEFWQPFGLSCVCGQVTEVKDPYMVIYNGPVKLTSNTKHNLFVPCTKEGCSHAIPIAQVHTEQVINALLAMGVLED